MLCVDSGMHIHVLRTHGHTCTSYACMCSNKVQLFSLVSILQAASDKKASSLLAVLIESWELHSWQGRGPVCCVDGRSTKMGWSCPGLQPFLHFGIPAHPPPEPQSHIVPGPSALARGKTRHADELLVGWSLEQLSLRGTTSF